MYGVGRILCYFLEVIFLKKNFLIGKLMVIL